MATTWTADHFLFYQSSIVCPDYTGEGNCFRSKKRGTFPYLPRCHRASSSSSRQGRNKRERVAVGRRPSRRRTDRVVHRRALLHPIRRREQPRGSRRRQVRRSRASPLHRHSSSRRSTCRSSSSSCCSISSRTRVVWHRRSRWVGCFLWKNFVSIDSSTIL